MGSHEANIAGAEPILPSSLSLSLSPLPSLPSILLVLFGAPSFPLLQEVVAANTEAVVEFHADGSPWESVSHAAKVEAETKSCLANVFLL